MSNDLPISYKNDMPKRLRELLKKGDVLSWTYEKT